MTSIILEVFQVREFFSVAGVVFLAELADKTQLTVLGFSSGGINRWLVFAASSAGLILSTALAVLIGDALNRYIPADYLNYGVGGLFILMGLWFLGSPLIG